MQSDALNIVGQKLPTLLDMLHVASVYTPCCMLLGVVGSCCARFEAGQTLSQQLPTFLLFRDRRSVAQQCWISLHSSFSIVGVRRTRIPRDLLQVTNFYRMYPPQDALQVPKLLGVVASVYTCSFMRLNDAFFLCPQNALLSMLYSKRN